MPLPPSIGPHRSNPYLKKPIRPYDGRGVIKPLLTEESLLKQLHTSDIVQHGIIQAHLGQLNSSLISYIQEGPSLEIWSPDTTGADSETVHHLRELQIPLVNGKPNVLLHDLGRFKSDPALAARVNGIFEGMQHTFLVNTSGSGKTRLLLEGLCDRWGFYFTSIVDATGLGSSDIQAIIDTFIPNDTEFHLDLPGSHDSSHDSLLRKNRSIAKRGFNQALLARLHIFKLFLLGVDRLQGGEAIAEPACKLHWLILQLFPALGQDQDVFLSLCETIAPTSLRYATSMVRIQLQEIQNLLPQSSSRFQKLFCVLDEAQHAAKQHCSSFRSYSKYRGHIPRPILRELIGAWTDPLCGNRKLFMVISGTGISKEEVAEVIASAMAKDGSACLISDTGAFETLEQQRNYLLRYLPPSLAYSQSGERLLERVWNWLRGRHRFTATYLNALILDKFTRPHNLLNRYVEHLTKFKPTDAVTYVNAEGQADESTIFKDVRSLCLELSRQRNRFSDTQMTILHKMVNDSYMLNCITGVSGTDDIAFVDGGFARFGDLTASKIVFDEPLIILAATKWLDESYQTIYRFWASRMSQHSPDYNGFEGMLAYCISLMFGSRRRLDEVFTFHGRVPGWASQTAQLVAVHQSEANGWAAEISEVDGRRGASANLGLRAHTPPMVYQWMSNCFKIPICFPVIGMGPDILFVLQLSDGSLIWVAVQSKNQQYLGPSDLANAIRSVTPSRFYVQANGGHHCKSAFPFLVDATRSKLLELPHRRRDSGLYGLLRVVASFPAEATSSNYIEEDCDTEGHPLASLNFKAVESMTRNMSPLGFWTTMKERGYSRLVETRTEPVILRSLSPDGVDEIPDPEEDSQADIPASEDGLDGRLWSLAEVQSTPILEAESTQSQITDSSVDHKGACDAVSTGTHDTIEPLSPTPENRSPSSCETRSRSRWCEYEIAGALG